MVLEKTDSIKGTTNLKTKETRCTGTICEYFRLRAEWFGRNPCRRTLQNHSVQNRPIVRVKTSTCLEVKKEKGKRVELLEDGLC